MEESKMKARKPIKPVKNPKPSAADIKATKDLLKAKIAKDQEAFNIAENKFDAAEAEFECQREFLDDADNDLQDSEYELEEFNELLQYAKDFDDWKYIIKFKVSR